jgi:hypothetical protein
VLKRATGFEASVVEGRFMIHTRRGQGPWIVIVEPDAEARLLVVVTVYEVWSRTLGSKLLKRSFPIGLEVPEWSEDL